MSGYGNGGEWNGPMQGGALGPAIDFSTKNANPISRNPSVGAEMERAEKASAQLHSTIDQLFARLEPILTPMPPQVAGSAAGNTPEPPQSGIVRLLKAQGYRIDAASQRIAELLQRIEL